MVSSLAQVVWQSPQLAPAAVGISCAVAAAVLWLYPPQTHGLPWFWRWTMPLLRALAAGAITIAILQPIALRPRTAARQGAVVLMVDRSRSMTAVDRDRSPAELVALAGGLGALPPSARQEAASGLRGRLDGVRLLVDQLARARSEADYATLAGRGTTAAAARVREATDRLRAALADLELPPAMQPTELGRQVAALRQPPPALDDAALRTVRGKLDATGESLDAAQRQLDEALFNQNPYIRDAAARLGALSRAELVDLGLAQKDAAGAGLVARLSAVSPVFGFAFDADVASLPWPADTSAVAVTNSPEAGARTDLAAALRSAMQRIGTRPVQAVVLISDGRQAGADADADTLAGDVAAMGVPIFAVSTAGARRDVAVASVDAPAAAWIGQTITVRAHVRAGGGGASSTSAYKGATIVVGVTVGSTTQAREAMVDEDGDAVVDFQVTMRDAGAQEVVVDAAAKEVSLAAEATRENNRFVRPIRVGAEPARVTVLSGDETSAAFRGLHATLSRAAWVTLREVGVADLATLAPRSILAQDVVILLDLPPDAVSRAQWDALEQLVRVRGGSVVVCAGQYAPQVYIDDPLTARLMPFSATQRPAWRTWPGGGANFRVAPPTEGRSADDLADAGDAGAMDDWRQLPPLSRIVPAPPLGANARALLVERESGAAVVTETRRGLGRLYFVGTDETARWRTTQSRTDGRARDPFWPPLLRLAAGDPFAAVRDNVRLDADDLAPEPRQPIVVRAKVLDAFGDPVDAATQTLEIRRHGSGERVRDVTMNLLADGSGRYAATIEAGLDAGDYFLHLDAPEDPSVELQPDPVELQLRVAPRYETELADVSGDERLLQRLANVSGGQFLSLEQLASLPQRLETVRQRQSRLVEYPLWDSPYLFVFVLACLSTEWALRKKFGLA